MRSLVAMPSDTNPDRSDFELASGNELLRRRRRLGAVLPLDWHCPDLRRHLVWQVPARESIMQNLVSTVIALAAVAPLAAQFTTPAGFLNKPGNSSAYNLALGLASSSFRNVRCQTTVPGMTRAGVLTRMDWRTAVDRSYVPARGQGRSFSNVTLRLGHGIAVLGRNMSGNFRGAATTVFSGSWSQPRVLSGIPKQVWGNAGSFGFSKTLVFKPTTGPLLQEWTHSGGKLANGYSGASQFYLDSNHTPWAGSVVLTAPQAKPSAASRYLPKFYVNSAGGACNDSTIASTTSSAFAYTSLWLYGPAYPTLSLRGRGRIVAASATYVAPGKPVVGMLSLWGNDAGVNIGARCNKLHVNPNIPLAVVVKKASTSTSAYTNFMGPGGFMRSPFLYNPLWAGARVYWQAAWEDRTSKAFSLTVASRLTLPALPVGPRNGIATVVYEFYGANRKLGPYVITNFHPIERWNQK